MFGLMIATIWFNIFDKSWSGQLRTFYDYLLIALHQLAQVPVLSWLQVGTPITFLTFKWTLTAIIVNLVTIVFAIFDIANRKDRKSADTCVAVLLGILIVFHAIAFPVSITERFDFNAIVIFTYVTYLVTDLIGMRKAGGQDRRAADYPIYFYPAFCLDGPTLAVIIVFLFASSWAPITKDFYDGIGAGILMLSGFVYTGLLGFVIPERIIHIKGYAK